MENVLFQMAGHGVDDDPNLKGLNRLFNAETNRGRGNVSELAFPLRLFALSPPIFNFCLISARNLQCAKATYAVAGLVIAYFVLRPKKQPATK